MKIRVICGGALYDRSPLHEVLHLECRPSLFIHIPVDYCAFYLCGIILFVEFRFIVDQCRFYQPEVSVLLLISDVEDNGPGIPSHLQDTLFYPMVSGREGGTGLGLSIARSLIDQHSGKIEFTSWPGHTEFSVYLPIRK